MGLKRCILFLCILCALHTQAQQAATRSSKKGKDIQVRNNGYTLYFASADVIDAITYIDGKTGENHSAAIQQLQQGLIKQVDLQQTAKDNPFVAALKKSVGVWLLYHGKGYVEKDGVHVNIIVSEDAPQMEQLDGSTRKTVFFSEPDMSTAIFCGDISDEVAHDK